METDIEITSRFEEYYMNQMQILVNVIDANNIFAEVARAGGKTGRDHRPSHHPRVANDMPGELSFLVHKTYVALMTNVWPNLQAYFSREVTVGGKVRSMLEYGIDMWWAKISSLLISASPDIPYPTPKHSVVFRDGHHIQLVSSDRRSPLPDALPSTPSLKRDETQQRGRN